MYKVRLELYDIRGNRALTPAVNLKKKKKKKDDP